MTKAIVGVIGGSGVYHLPGLTDLREEAVPTPWGEPSDALRFGRIGDDRGRLPRPARPRPPLLALDDQLPRQHRRAEARRRHRHHRALGLRLVPSRPLSRRLRPDRPVRGPDLPRESTFFGTGCVAHVSMAHPIAPLLRRRLRRGGGSRGHSASRTAEPIVCMEGPQFSSLAESLGYQARGADVIGMTGRDRGQARARGGDLLRVRRHGDRLRLLARGARRRRRRRRRQGDARQRREGGAARRPGAARTFPPSTSPARSAPTARSNTRSSPTPMRAIPSSSGSSTRSRAACSGAAERGLAAPQRGVLARPSGLRRKTELAGAARPDGEGSMVRTGFERFLFGGRFLLTPLYFVARGQPSGPAGQDRHPRLRALQPASRL